MNLRSGFLGFMLLLQVTGTLAAPPAAEADRRLHNLSGELRCLVCQNQSLADSDADLAIDLRREIRTMIEAGKSDVEIRDFLATRYGDFILYEPPFSWLTALLWLGPVIFLIIGLGLLTHKFDR